jgi:TPR repeat protein
LGIAYLHGYSVIKDVTKALELIIDAASSGHPAAFHNLGLIYELGLGVPNDSVYAYLWFDVAASAGHGEAAGFRDGIAMSLSQEDITQAKEMSLRCQEKRYKNCISF